MQNEFNIAIVRELLLEIEPNVDNVIVMLVWSMTKGNPWNAPIIYKILRVNGEI